MVFSCIDSGKTKCAIWVEFTRQYTLAQTDPLVMGCKSKATLSCIDNLRRAPPKSHQATVEEASDSDADDMDYTPAHDDFDSGSEADDDGEEEQRWSEIQGQFYFLEDDFSNDSDLPDMDCVSDSDIDDMELDEEEEADIKNDAALLGFSSVLQCAQEIATAAERRKWGERKRPKQYTKNAAWTLQRHAQK